MITYPTLWALPVDRLNMPDELRSNRFSLVFVNSEWLGLRRRGGQVPVLIKGTFIFVADEAGRKMNKNLVRFPNRRT
jgi:hypothetical protein